MKHVNDIELIEYMAGNLAESRDGKVREHLAACDECSERWRETANMWDALVQWSVDTAGHDIAGRITALAEKTDRDQRQRKKLHVLRLGFLPMVLRVAASIIIAVGVGHRLGKYSVTGKMESAAVSKNRPEYLAALGLEWSSELAWLILEDDSSSMGENQ